MHYRVKVASSAMFGNSESTVSLYFNVATAERVAVESNHTIVVLNIVQCPLTCASFTILQKWSVIGTTVESVADKLLVSLCHSFWYVFTRWARSLK